MTAAERFPDLSPLERDLFLTLNPAMMTKQEVKDLQRLLDKVKNERATK
jgi:hypothetical protein